MNKHGQHRKIKYVGIVCFTVGIFLTIFLLSTPYNKFINTAAEYVGRPSDTDKLRRIIPSDTFMYISLLPCILGSMVAAGVALVPERLLNGHYIKLTALQLQRFIRHEISSVSRPIRFGLLGVVLIHLTIRIYYMYAMPVSYDEAFTYVNFSSRSFLSSVSYYPAPNNHILHSLITNTSTLLPLNPKYAIRIPVIAVSVLSVCSTFVLLKQTGKPVVALGLTAVHGALFPVLYYGYMSRGYGLTIFWFTISYVATVKASSRGRATNLQLLTLSFSGVAGMYTMPSFLYPYATLNLYLILQALTRKHYHEVVRIIAWGAFSGIVVCLLYVPVFLVSGVNSVVNNPFVKPLPREEVLARLPLHFDIVFEYLFNVSHAILLVSLVTIGASFIRGASSRQDFRLSIFTLLFSLCIPVIHSVIPFPRTWVHLTVPVLVLVAILADQITMHKPFILVTTLITTSLFINFHHKVYKLEDYAIEAKMLTDRSFHWKANRICTNDALMETYLNFHYQINELPVNVTFTRDFHTLDHMQPNEVNFDLYILKTQSCDPGDNFIMTAQNQYVKAFQRRDRPHNADVFKSTVIE